MKINLLIRSFISASILLMVSASRHMETDIHKRNNNINCSFALLEEHYHNHFNPYDIMAVEELVIVDEDKKFIDREIKKRVISLAENINEAGQAYYELCNKMLDHNINNEIKKSVNSIISFESLPVNAFHDKVDKLLNDVKEKRREQEDIRMKLEELNKCFAEIIIRCHDIKDYKSFKDNYEIIDSLVRTNISEWDNLSENIFDFVPQESLNLITEYALIYPIPIHCCENFINFYEKVKRTSRNLLMCLDKCKRIAESIISNDRKLSDIIMKYGIDNNDIINIKELYTQYKNSVLSYFIDSVKETKKELNERYKSLVRME